MKNSLDITTGNIIEFDVNVTSKFKWYVVHTYSGYETKVAASLKDRLEATGLKKYVAKIVVPTQKKIVVNDGKKKEINEKLFPGYVLVQMNLDDEVWSIIRKTDHVTGFIGTGTNPVPLPQAEVDSILKYMQREAPKFEAKFKEGDSVKVLEGPFKDFLGKVETINQEQGKAKVLISSFGREVPVEFDLAQISQL